MDGKYSTLTAWSTLDIYDKGITQFDPYIYLSMKMKYSLKTNGK